MTISEVLAMDSTQLKALTSEELEKQFAHYFNVTRPEFAIKQKESSVNYISPEKRIAFEKVKEASGFDLAAFMLENRKKRKK